MVHQQEPPNSTYLAVLAAIGEEGNLVTSLLRRAITRQGRQVCCRRSSVRYCKRDWGQDSAGPARKLAANEFLHNDASTGPRPLHSVVHNLWRTLPREDHDFLPAVVRPARVDLPPLRGLSPPSAGALTSSRLERLRFRDARGDLSDFAPQLVEFGADRFRPVP